MNSKRSITIFLSACLLLLACLEASAQQVDELSVIPMPVAVQPQKSVFELGPATGLSLGKGISAQNLASFNQYLNALGGFTLSPSAKKTAKGIVLELNAAAVPQKEGYSLTVSAEQVKITGHDEAGVFYGLQTLTQLLRKGQKAKLIVPGCIITDYPRFGYRGMHLDVSRHMFPVASIKKWIDILALYKVNTFHWHLTDDQGWRIEIKKFPELQKAAAYRDETIIGHKRSDPHRFDGKPYGGYYTQEEVKEIVRYAAQRQITVIPEIEMPGHAQAALAAYPKLGCTGGPYQTATYWGVFDNVYCAGKEDTFTFLQQVLDEVLPLFPSHYIHIGGDESPKTQWKVCPSCQARIKAENLKDEHELQSYFIQRMEKYLISKGREIIGWDEILEGGLAPSATVMSWRGLEGGIAAAKLRHNVIMTPEKYVYLDYFQSLYDNEQTAAGGYTPLEKVYAYEPVPEELSPEEAVYIKGVQANVWSEYLSSPEKAEYAMFPRMFALSEIAWSPKKQRNYANFLSRLREQKNLISKLKINDFRNYDEVKGELAMKDGLPELRLQSSNPAGLIRYTSDGTKPDKNSPVYHMTLRISKTSTIRAAVFNGNNKPERIYEQAFVVSKATGKSFVNMTDTLANVGQQVLQGLLNGVQGSKYYNDGQWTTFSGENLDAVLDLGKIEIIAEIQTQLLKYHWQRMWEPQIIKFAVSSDGENYTDVYSQNSFTDEGINKVIAEFKPMQARFVRFTAVNQGLIPAGAYGAGAKASLLLDEIIVN